MFKVGSIVKCVSGYGELKRNATYTVRRVTELYVYVKENTGGWYHDRFELVDDGRTSRTTDPVTSKGKRKVNKYEQSVLAIMGGGYYEPREMGWTGKELAAESGHQLNCITPRFAPLRRKGLIKDSGVKRDKQIVWVLA
jgi:hypothetical protein